MQAVNDNRNPSHEEGDPDGLGAARGCCLAFLIMAVAVVVVTSLVTYFFT